jgi:uncharacterized membrane protein YphA (DoxX/SURF4 family)
MDIALWIVQGLLALLFLGAGATKATQNYDKLSGMMPWAKNFSPTIVKTIGVLEVLGAIGLILPSLTRILPILTPLAGVGLALTMGGAILTHVRRKEYPPVAVNTVLLLLAAFVAYGRFVLVPIVA